MPETSAVNLDHNATTRPAPEVVAAMVEMLETHWHNPSSVHRAGQAARQRIELARKQAAALIGARPRSITFTSSGTESIDLAIRGTLARALPAGKRVVVTSPIEHVAVRELLKDLAKPGAAGGPIEVREAALDAEGVVEAASVAELLTPDVALVTIQWANNETGAVHPVHDIGRLCRDRSITFHCDATQWVGKNPVQVSETSSHAPEHPVDAAEPLHVDLLTYSPHKFHGPKGVGVLYARPGVGFAPIIHGEQEQGRRGGTENAAGIVGLGVAAELALRWLADPTNMTAARERRNRFENAVLAAAPDAVVNGPRDQTGVRRLWNTSNISFPRLESEALLLLLSERVPAVYASAGAACSSGSLEPSPILKAMKIPPEIAHGAVRFSLSRETTDAEVEAGVGAVVAAVERLRKSMAGV